MALWTIAHVAAWASLAEGSARKKLDQLKVPYIDFGRGRGLGRRWEEDEVKKAFNSLRSDRVQKSEEQKGRKPLGLFRNGRDYLRKALDSDPKQRT
jgi:hypothetical protein